MQEQTRVIPHLTCRNAKAAIEFYKRAFGAEGMCVLEDPEGRMMHGAVFIDGAPIYLVEEFADCGGTSPQALGGSPVTIHLQVADCDAVFNRATEAGCAVAMPLEDMFWGDRFGMLIDPFGHKWSIATTKRLVSPDELQQAMSAMAAA